MVRVLGHTSARPRDELSGTSERRESGGRARRGQRHALPPQRCVRCRASQCHTSRHHVHPPPRHILSSQYAQRPTPRPGPHPFCCGPAVCGTCTVIRVGRSPYLRPIVTCTREWLHKLAHTIAPAWNVSRIVDANAQPYCCARPRYPACACPTEG